MQRLRAGRKVLVTVGRRPRTKGWGLENMGVAMAGPFVKIDDRCATSMKNVWAVGDLTGERPPLYAALATRLRIKDITHVKGVRYNQLVGYGLVVGLDGTGDDPPPSTYREMILTEMRRRNVNQPNAILASPNTALVVVRAYLPPLVRKGDTFDVEVRLPGNGDATSLNGSIAAMWRLRYIAGRVRGAEASGPVAGVASGRGVSRAPARQRRGPARTLPQGKGPRPASPWPKSRPPSWTARP